MTTNIGFLAYLAFLVIGRQTYAIIAEFFKVLKRSNHCVS